MDQPVNITRWREETREIVGYAVRAKSHKVEVRRASHVVYLSQPSGGCDEGSCRNRVSVKSR